MFVQDCLQGVYVVLMTKKRTLLAGCADGLSDVFMLYSIGGGGARATAHPLSLLGVLIPAALFVGSALGAPAGDHLSMIFTGRTIHQHRADGMSRHAWIQMLTGWWLPRTRTWLRREAKM